MIKGAPEGSRGGLGLCDVVDFEDQERVFDAVMQTSTLGEEQDLGQKRAEVSFRRGRQRTKTSFFFIRFGYETDGRDRKIQKTELLAESLQN